MTVNAVDANRTGVRIGPDPVSMGDRMPSDKIVVRGAREHTAGDRTQHVHAVLREVARAR